MSENNPVYLPPACWCRNCDHAAKASLSPLERMRTGARFIVCPDCGNKRCPKGTNHELACTNSNLSGQKGSEWENVKPSGFVTLTTEQVQAERRSAYAYAFTGPALLTTAQLATLADTLAGERQSCEDEPTTPLGYWPTAVAALLSHVEALADRVKEMQAELAEQERAKLLLIQETHRWSAAVKKLESERITRPQACWGNSDATPLPGFL